MSEKTVTITEQDGAYQIQNNGISEFALVGILECVLFDLKTARTEKQVVEREFTPNVDTNVTTEKQKQLNTEPETKRDNEAAETPIEKQKTEPAASSNGPSNNSELRTRIGNAVKAIKALGGEVDETSDRSGATDEGLKTELEELTEQYKRLKNSKSAKK